MSRKQTLEQRISNLINEYGLAEVKRCVDMASYLMNPTQAKKTRKPRATAPVVVETKSA